MALDVLALTKELVGLGSTLAKARYDRRVALADYLDKIAKCVESIAGLVRRGDRDGLTSPCAELEVYAEGCGDILKEILEPPRSTEIAKKIWQATYTRRGYSASYEMDTHRWDPSQFDAAAGHLRGMANTLRAPEPIVPSKLRRWLSRSED